MKGGIPYMGIFPGRRTRAHIDQSDSAPINGINVSKEVCFWLWGKDNLIQLTKETSIT